MHEESSPTATSSSTASKPTSIVYASINEAGGSGIGEGGHSLNGNLLITTSPIQDATSSLFELVQQHHQPPLQHQTQHHQQQIMTSTQPIHTTKIIITNNPLISTSTSPVGVRSLQHHHAMHQQHQQQQQQHHVQPSSSTSVMVGSGTSSRTAVCSTAAGTTTIVINTNEPPFDAATALQLSSTLEAETSGASGGLLADVGCSSTAATALIDLHPSSSSSSTTASPPTDRGAAGGGIHFQELTATATSSASGSSDGVGLHEPIEIKIPSEGSFTEGSDGGYHENISQTQSNYLAIPPSELCPVCGDKVSGYHYGLLTCESCKGFFKRTVQNKKVYTCVAERQCHIDKTQRKRCPYCRFQKCLEVGMKLEAVRADRMRGGRNKFGPMYKRDRARKLQIMRQRQLAIQALRGSIGGGVGIGQLGSDGASPQLQGIDYHQPYSSMHIKQEIQIPQVSSLTSSPDSSPSPIAIALGQVNPQTTISLSSGVGGNGSSGGGGGGGGNNNGSGGSNSTLQTLQNQLSESKLWMSANSTTASPHSLSPKTFSFDSGTIPTSTADSGNPADTLRVSPMIRDFVQSIDDREWQTALFSLLQNQTYNQCEVDLFELMCKVLDQNLFSQVDWARNTIFFKDLKVDDQMKLLQNSWSDMLVLDHIHQRLHNGLPDETNLHNGQKFDLLGLGLLGVPSMADHFNELQNKLQELKFDVGDYICMKFLLLLNPEVRAITNRKTVVEGYENVQAALLDYTLTCYPSVPDKFSKLLSIIPEIHVISSRGEGHLYMKHCAGSAPSQTLLMEMLHAKRK
ncbi:nuclear hormone receptor FTZ-F1-like isoform X2 [Toxorhynchites rutilus septentrionalis]|uniref:nuclear hormone receptor FTZ-F1-like isoform X2 n=1 Tax=Toxorhynchites rutilus septentrionalis TaxID=329112 RepID=UPI0024792E38|nr:nuclear hormone receptor FTZ-F1-like isoform X2 [Toxorhynchites rutilus septentrionalis]